MVQTYHYKTAELVAIAAADDAVKVLNSAIELNGQAVWALAGGSSPVVAYKYIIDNYSDKVDWSNVSIVIGDERLVPIEHQDSNWGSIMQLFNENEAFSEMKRISPEIYEDIDYTANAYEDKIRKAGIKHFDLVWAGVGEDGHTLSLFPGNPGFTEETSSLIVPVRNSPKPPSERVSLSLTALKAAKRLVIFATGAAKRDALERARLEGDLPVSKVAEVVSSNDGEVIWLYDEAAWGQEAS